MNGRARRAPPQETPKRRDPLLEALDRRLPQDAADLDTLIERRLSRLALPGMPRPGQAFPSGIDPEEFRQPFPRIPRPPPVVEETTPPPPPFVGPMPEGRFSRFLRGQAEEPFELGSRAAPMPSAPRPRGGEVQGPLNPRDLIPGGAGSVAPWSEVLEPPEMPDTRNKYYRSRVQVRPDGQMDPMPQDASFVHGFTNKNLIETLPPSKQIEFAEEQRRMEEQRRQNFIGPPTEQEIRQANITTMGRTLGMVPGSMARLWQGTLNLGELAARQLPTEGVPMGLRIVHQGIADALEDAAGKASDFAEYWMPGQGTSFYDVLENPTRVAEWGLPAISQGLTSSGMILGAMAVGGPLAYATAFTLNYPDLVDELEEAGLDRKDALEYGAIATLPVAFFDTQLPELIHRRIMEGAMTQLQGQAVLARMRRQLQQGMARRTAEEALKAGSLEGFTEALQEGIQFGAGELARSYTGEDRRTFQEFVQRVIEAGAAGALPGGLFGAGASINLDVPRETGGEGPKMTPREFLSMEHEYRAAAGEYGEEAIPAGRALTEERLRAQSRRATKGITVEPIEDFEVTDYQGPERRGDIDMGPPEGVEDRRSYDVRVNELTEQLYNSTAGTKYKKFTAWLQRVRTATSDMPGDPAFRYARTLAHQILDGRTDEELITPSMFLQHFGRTAVEEAPEPEAPTGKPSPATERRQQVFRNEKGEEVLVQQNMRGDGKPWRATFFEPEGGVVHQEYDSYESAFLNVSSHGFKPVSEEQLGEEGVIITPPPAATEAKAAPQGAEILPVEPTDVARVDVEDLQTIEGAQYKRYGAQAASQGLEGAQEWNEDLAGTLLVWKGPPGAEFDKPAVINGHNRYAAALRLRQEGKQVPPLLVRFIEAETLADARAKGALTNIAEGRGTEWDAAEFFREGGFTIEDLTEKGLTLKEGMVNRGFALSKLIPKLYLMAQRGNLASTANASMEKGVIIGQAGLSEKEQQGLLKHFNKKGVPSLERLPTLLRTAKGIAAKESKQADLWGETWVDESLLEEKTDIGEAVERSIRDDARLSRKLLSVAEAAREAEAGDINELRAAEIGEQAAELEQAFYVAQRQDATVSEILNRQAKRLREAKNKAERSEVLDEAVNEIIQQLETYPEAAAVGSRARGQSDREGGAPTGEGRVSEPATEYAPGEEAVQGAEAAPIEERNGLYYVQYPGGQESMGFRDPRLAQTHAERIGREATEAPPRNLGQTHFRISDEIDVVRNPRYAKQRFVSPDFAYAVLHKPTGRILDEGSLPDMMEEGHAYAEGKDLPDASVSTEEVLALEGEDQGEVVGTYTSLKDTNDALSRLLARRDAIQKKLAARRHAVRPADIADTERLTTERDAIQAEMDAVYEAQQQIIEARRQAASEEQPAVLVHKRFKSDGTYQYDVVASPDYKRAAAEQVRRERVEESAKRATERETRLRELVTEAQTVYSAPTPLLNESITIEQWMKRLVDMLPKNKAGKVKKVSSVKGVDNLFELQVEAEALFTHLAQNPLLIHSIDKATQERLHELVNHPWFHEERTAGSGERPMGQKKVMVVANELSKSGVNVEANAQASWDQEKKQWYVDRGGKRVYLQTQQVRNVASSDPLTEAIGFVRREVMKRGADIFAAKKLQAAEGEGPVNPEAAIDMGGKYEREQQEDLFGEPKVIKLETPQMELNLEGSQREQLVSQAYRTVANYYRPWKDGQATERQMSHLHNAMKLLSVWAPENKWGFSQTDLNELDAHFGNLRGTVKERLQTSDDQMDVYGLDPGGGVGFVDFYPSYTMPGAGQFHDDAKMTAELADELRKAGLDKVFKKGIPSRREAVRNIGRSLMTPITTGRTNFKGSFGRFYVGIRSIRTKWAYDMETVGHEVGHAIMHLVWGPSAYTEGGNLSGRVLVRFRDELFPFARDYQEWLNDPTDEGVPLVEAFAEWSRRYITNRNGTVEVDGYEVPIKNLELTQFVEESLRKTDPGVLEAMDFAETVYKMWRNATPEARILSQFQFKKEYKDDRAWAWLMVPPLARVKRAWIDLHVPFDTIVQTFNPGRAPWDPLISLDENPALWVRLMAGAPASGDEAWMYGITDPETGERLSKGAEPVIARAISSKIFGSQQEGFYLLTAFGAAARNIERAQVALKRAQRAADRLNEERPNKGEGVRFVVRESPKEPGAFDIYDLFTDKIVGRRFKQYILGFSYEDSLKVIQNAKDGGYYDLFRETMDDLYAYADARLEYLVKMGVTTQEEAERIRDGSKFYVPMVPVIERLDQRKAEYHKAFPRHELAKPPSAPRHMKAPGTAAPKRNWIEQLYIDNQYLHLLAMRHRTLQALYQMTKRHRGTAIFLEEIATPTKGIPVRMKQLINQLDQRIDSEVVDYLKENLGDEGMASSLMVYLPGDYMDDIDTVRVRDPDTGKYVWLQVNDPELLGALLGMEHKPANNFFMRFLAGSAKSLRVGATITPGFSLFRNPSRDAMQAWIMSEWGIKLGYDHVRAIYHMLGRDELYQKYLQSGAAFASLLDFDAKGIARKVQKAQRSKIANVAGNVGEALKLLGTWTENMNRFAEYERAYEALIAAGAPEMEARARAAYAARDITVDFWRHGYQTAGLRRIAAFWNANLQGWDKLIRSAREHPLRFMMRTFQGITVPSILLWLVNHDDDEYQALPRWLRDFYWLIPVDLGTIAGGALGALTGNPALMAAGAAGGHKVWEELFGDELAQEDQEAAGYVRGSRPRDLAPVVARGGKVWIKLPKPFFLGQLFGTTVERALDYASGEDGRILDHLHNMAMSEITSLLPMPTAGRAFAEAFSGPEGYSWFQQRHLMDTEMASRDRWTQYTPSTSAVARILGEGSARLTGTQGLSPVKIDHLIYSFFGTAARDVTRMTDYSLRFLGAAANRAGLTEEAHGQEYASGRPWYESFPIANDLFQRWPYRASAHVDQLYELWDKVERQYNTQGFLQDVGQMSGDPSQVDRYMRQHPGLFGEYYGVASAYATLALLNTQQRAIMADRRLTDKQRRAALGEIYMRKDDLARRALEAYERANR